MNDANHPAPRRNPARLTLWAGLAAVLGVAACSDRNAPDSFFSDYLWRLENVTGTQVNDAFQPLPVPPYPRPRALRAETADLRIGFIDFFRLDQCRLQQEISQRNTSLGRVQRPSGRLLYELRFHQKIVRCEQQLAQTEAAGELLAQVAAIRQAKTANLAPVLWNATFASPEFAYLMSPATAPLQRDEPLSFAAVELALERLAAIAERLYGPAPALTEAQLEEEYFRLQADHYLGKLLHGFSRSEFYLRQASRLLEQAAAERQLCPEGRKTRQAEYLHNVFIKYYAGGIQPYLSQLHSPARQIIPVLDRLLRLQKIPPPAPFRRYYAATLDPADPASLWNRFQQQLKAHTEAWQRLLKQCGLMPTGAGGQTG